MNDKPEWVCQSCVTRFKVLGDKEHEIKAIANNCERPCFVCGSKENPRSFDFTTYAHVLKSRKSPPDLFIEGTGVPARPSLGTLNFKGPPNPPPIVGLDMADEPEFVKPHLDKIAEAVRDAVAEVPTLITTTLKRGNEVISQSSKPANPQPIPGWKMPDMVGEETTKTLFSVKKIEQGCVGFIVEVSDTDAPIDAKETQRVFAEKFPGKPVIITQGCKVTPLYATDKAFEDAVMAVVNKRQRTT